MDIAEIFQLFDSTLRNATPLLLACLAGLFSERAGIFDIGLEGKMLAAAFAAAAVAAWVAAPYVEDPFPGQISGLGLGWAAAWAGVLGGDAGLYHAGADPWLCLDYPAREPADFGGGDQLPSRRAPRC